MALRSRLNLPANRPVLLSVGAINRWHKPMDYVVTEVASLPPDEALSHGLPCLVDDNPVTRYVLGDDADFGHLSEPGSLARLFRLRIARPLDPPARAAQADRTRLRFAWDRLTPSYIDMIHRAASTPRGSRKRTPS